MQCLFPRYLFVPIDDKMNEKDHAGSGIDSLLFKPFFLSVVYFLGTVHPFRDRGGHYSLY